jgi:hypothetical protein
VPNATAGFALDHSAGKEDKPLFDQSDMGRRMLQETDKQWGKKPKNRFFDGLQTDPG